MLKGFLGFAAALIVALAPWPAIASAPTLDGSYELTTIDLCQMVAHVDETNKLTVTDPGVQGIETYTIDFNSTALSFTASGNAIAMTSIYELFSDNTHQGSFTDAYPVSTSGAYSNTATSLTIDKGSKGAVNYKITYGQIGPTGIAQNFSAIAVIDKHCMFMLQAQHQ